MRCAWWSRERMCGQLGSETRRRDGSMSGRKVDAVIRGSTGGVNSIDSSRHTRTTVRPIHRAAVRVRRDSGRVLRDLSSALTRELAQWESRRGDSNPGPLHYE